jgi:hypothetical protein
MIEPRVRSQTDSVLPVPEFAGTREPVIFQDQTITRLGEKTIFSVGEGPRTLDLGSGQFLLCVPKKAGGAKVKVGSVTAAITG